jgi:hypothetical protein
MVPTLFRTSIQRLGQAYLGYQPTSTSIQGESWVSSLIQALWQFTREMWSNRNHIVHGATVEEVAAILLPQLQEKVQEQFEAYTNTPGYVLPRHEYLFTQCSLPQRLNSTYDGLQCRLRSVTEARQILNFQIHYLRETSTQVLS